MKKWSFLLAGVALLPLFLATKKHLAVKDTYGYNQEYLNTDADPCQDFYSFAIGGWQKLNPIPSTESRWAVFNILAKENEDKIEGILEGLQNTKAEKGSVEWLVSTYYASALDSQKRNAIGLKPLLDEIEVLNGIEDKATLVGYMAESRAKGLSPFFSSYVSTDARNSNRYLLHFGQGGLNLPDRDYYMKTDSASEQIQQKYQEHIQQVLEIVGVKGDLPMQAKEIYTLEKELASISMSRTERRDPDKTYHLFTHDQFEQEFTGLDWKQFFQKASFPNWKEAIVSQPDFIKKSLALFNERSFEMWKNYFRWRLVHSMAGSLNDELYNAHFDFYSRTLRGADEMRSHKERAVKSTNGSLGQPLGQLYVKQYFPEASKQMVADMVEDLRATFRERIKQLDWMGDTTKEKALEKLNAFTYKIGYPEEWKDYSSLDLSPDDYLGNNLKINQLEYRWMMEKAGQPVDKKEWGMTPQTVNAYYSSSKNEIVFPAGILQAPFFDPKADPALNYGGIGAVIGHEFSHGFDDKGSKFDAEGNLKNWWTDQDRKLFKERTDAIVQQFNNFEVLPDVNIKGEMTQGENIADLAGLTLAYHALIRHYGDAIPEGVGADGFSWDQRFFLGWAQVWAQNIKEKELRRRIITDPHSPGKYRVIGPLSNMKEFAKAFNCGDSSAMVAKPEVRVVIW